MSACPNSNVFVVSRTIYPQGGIVKAGNVKTPDFPASGWSDIGNGMDLKTLPSIVQLRQGFHQSFV